jgi:hypothetical protein
MPLYYFMDNQKQYIVKSLLEKHPAYIKLILVRKIGRFFFNKVN